MMTFARRAALFLAFGLAAVAAGGIAHGASDTPIDAQPNVHASFVAERAAVAPGGQVTVALREIIRKNWHTYWRNPGDSGLPTSITWHLPPGWKAGPIQWPYPARLPVGPLMKFGYADEVALLVYVSAPPDANPGDAAHLAADAMWLVCEKICVPEQTTLALDLAIAAKPPPPDADTEIFFATAREHLPHASPWAAQFAGGDAMFSLRVQAPELARARPREVVFFPYTDGYLDNAAPQMVEYGAGGLTLVTKPGWKLATAAKRAQTGAAARALGGLLVVTDASGRTEALDIMAAPVPVPGADIGFIEALLLAALGGLILNLMPCVLPVLSMKALAFARHGGGTRAARAEALAYGVGALLSFAALAGLLLALRAAGAAVGWGFQLQEPVVVAGLSLLMLAVGLNLSGLYEVGGRFAGLGQHFTERAGLTGSFFTGVLAVAVATPCTAPFMAAALGFALTQSTLVAFGVFVALGAGFALPFVALGFSPAALRLLPRPGAWMVRFRQVLAFPMYGAGLWLLWVLSLEAGPRGIYVLLASALLLTVALFAYGAGREASGAGRVAGPVAAVLALAGALVLLPFTDTGEHSAPLPAIALPHENYSSARLAELRSAGRPVFVNATAAWCITCLVNEKVTLSSKRVADAFAANHVAYLVADWTNRDAEVTALLTAYGRIGVPLYLYYAPGSVTANVLPQILTEGELLAAIAAPKN